MAAGGSRGAEDPNRNHQGQSDRSDRQEEAKRKDRRSALRDQRAI